jgi:predicted lipoprotein with Yx(FWY)xxD motif
MLLRLAVVAMLVLAVACGDDGGGQAPAEDTAAQTETAPDAPTEAPAEDAADAGGDAEGGATVAVASSDLGDVLVDGEGMTLYLFLNDDQGDSTCYDDCAANWPALVGEVTAGDGVDAALLSSVERDDGDMQVTYNDWPLYYFAGDSAPGDTNGQGVGEVWYAVAPGGDAVAQADGVGYGAEY